MCALFFAVGESRCQSLLLSLLVRMHSGGGRRKVSSRWLSGEWDVRNFPLSDVRPFPIVQVLEDLHSLTGMHVLAPRSGVRVWCVWVRRGDVGR